MIDRSALARHLAQRWRHCPMCQHREWRYVGEAVVHVSNPEVAPTLPLFGVPTAVVACGSCGFVTQITTDFLKP